ncbi:MAG TPA: hypothetical protein VEU08_03650 [Vicinamibacterales bacterium]|nr:hypothetical protein [Vicinamibacterales bacterium]
MVCVRRIVAAVFACAFMRAVSASAQDAPAHDHSQMMMAPASGWTFAQDGVFVLEFNHQGSDRGGTEIVAPNWWMGMASRDTSQGRFTFTGMFSLDPATVGRDGYRELFQSSEAIDGNPFVDRQHPHDFFMQLAASWRMPITPSTGLTLAGGPAGEPSLGPVAYMHRASAMDNPSAPLSHHTFDSTHISYGVVTAAVDHGPFVVEGSVFNGREPDANRWDFDFGRLDSYSGRVWFKPNDDWEFQASSGHLSDPEQLEPGHDITRTTISGSWMRKDGESLTAVSAGFGHNATDFGGQTAFFAEGARHLQLNTIYGRIESAAALDTGSNVFAVTLGGVHDIVQWRGFEGGVGADLTLYGVPDVLQPVYGAHPLSLHLFFRLRPPAGPMGRMWNMRMAHAMGHKM